MRRILNIVILVALLWTPVKRLNISHLEPVQTVAVSIQQELVVLETDTENKGRGKNIEEALKDLKENTPGVIYLDTAQYLLVTENAEVYLNTLREYLSPSVKVASWDGISSARTAAEYLRIRKDLPRLKNLK